MDHLQDKKDSCPARVKVVRALNAELGEYYVTRTEESKRTKTVVGPVGFVKV